MQRRLADLVLRLAVLVGVGVSSALLWDYFRPLPAFCAVGSGCDRVRASGYGALLGIPVPLVGVIGFVSVLAMSLGESSTARRLTRGLAFFAGATGLLLLLVQAIVLRVFCRLCVTVDVASIVAAGAALAGARLLPRAALGSPTLGSSSLPRAEAHEPRASGQRAQRRLWIGAALAGIALPGLWSLIQPSPPVPPEIARLWRANSINVVEFADFQCPFCRELHPAVSELLHEYEGRVSFVRLNMPLASHSHARDAARAYVCADQLGRGPAMADALFASDDLTPDGCVRLATSLGLDTAQFRACVSSASTDARIDEEMRQVRAAGLAGLPTVWIGDQVLVGARPKEDLREAFERAAAGAHRRLSLAWLWGALAAVLAWVAWRACRQPHPAADHL